MPSSRPVTYSIHLLRHLRLTIGHNIHAARMKQKITLQKLSRLTGIPLVMLDHYEIGKNEIDLNDMFKMACVLQIEIKELIN